MKAYHGPEFLASYVTPLVTPLPNIYNVFPTS